jgi:uncharacterized protein
VRLSSSLTAILALAGALLLPNISFGQTVERGAPLARKAALGAQLGPSEGGTALVRVLPGSSAAKAQLKDGDILLKLNGVETPNPAAVSTILRGLTAGGRATYVIKRGSETLTLSGNLLERARQTEEGLTVTYDQVVSKGKRVRIIATHPAGPGPHPTLFLIGGIGAYSIDGPYASTAYGNILGPLSKSMAIVRVDKPGQGDSEGPASYGDLLFDDELDAYLQSVRLAKTLPFVDRDKIVIFGHSMGGAFGPLVAAQEKVAGVIAVGTMSKTWVEYMLENTRRQSSLAGASPDQVDGELRSLAIIATALFAEGLSLEQAAARNPAMKDEIARFSPDGKTYSGVGISFFHQLAQKNLIEGWIKAGTKTLMMWGENDFISTEWDHQFVVDALNAKNPGSAVYRKLPQSDHGFFQTESFRDSMVKWGRPGGKFNPNVIETIRDWLKESLAISA